MAVSYGFYDSLNGDRKYSAIQMSRIFDGIIMDGVYQNVGNHLNVKANGGMNIVVETGRAWFDHTWTYNDAPLPLTLDNSELINPRIDTVVLEVNSDPNVRQNRIFILKGTPAASPAVPGLSNTTTRKRYRLANIRVNANVKEITQANITNRIGTSECPYVTGPLKTMTIDTIVAQWESQFMTWFTELEQDLEGNPVTNLQAQLNKNNRFRRATLYASGWSSSSPYTQSVTITGLQAGDSPFIQCSADPANKSSKKLYQKNWGYVDSIEVTNNTIKATCKFDRPTIDLPIIIKGR